MGLHGQWCQGWSLLGFSTGPESVIMFSVLYTVSCSIMLILEPHFLFWYICISIKFYTGKSVLGGTDAAPGGVPV